MTELYHDQSRNLLVYRADPLRASHILQRIPEAREIGGKYVALPHTLQNAQTLRWLNFPVPPVITESNYDWPIERGRKPWESQRLTANFLVSHPRAFVLSDMGVGKSNAALWAADYLMRQHEPGAFRALIVAPLSTLERVWGNAIFANFLSRRSFTILHGDAERRISRLNEPHDFYIINFDGISVGAKTYKKLELGGFSAELAKRSDIGLVIVDEASAYKDSQTRRHRIARLVIGSKPYLWLMSGTPTPNAPTDAYGLAKLVNNAQGKSFTGFRAETMYKLTQFKWVPMRDGYDRARRLLQPSIRFAIEDVWDGPELTTQQRQVELTPDQKKHLHDLKQRLQVIVKSGTDGPGEAITATNEAAVRTKFIQIVLGAIYDHDHKAHAIACEPRLAELRAILEEAPGKALVFCPLTSVVNMLHTTLKGWGQSVEVVNGDVSAKDRNRIFHDFQTASDPRVLVAHPDTMAHGLDLWQARTVLWYGPTDKAEIYAQANKRAHRPGQKYPVTVVQLVATALEREIYRRLETNTSLQGMLLEAVRKDLL